MKGKEEDGCLFLGWLDSLAVLASDDLNLLSLNHLVRLHLERGVLDYERPDVVTQAVRFQVTLEDQRLVKIANRWLPHTLRVVLVLTCLTMVSAKDLSNCKEEGKLAIACEVMWSMGLQTCWRTFMANWGVIAPLVISSSRESVRAIPILLN